VNQGTRDYLQSVYEDCIECGVCTSFQEQMGQVPLTFGEIARKLMDAEDAAAAEGGSLSGRNMPEDVYDFARSCLMCGRCTSRCPVDIRAPKVVAAAREVIVEAMPRVVGDYRRYRCDRADSMFNRIRTTQQDKGNIAAAEGAPTIADATIPFDDALADTPDAKTGKSLFFPGCSLNNNFPGLTEHVRKALEDAGIIDCTSRLCCGRPLFLIGLRDDREAYYRELSRRIVASGVERVIVSCPNCYYTMGEVFASCGIDDKVELRFLSDVLAEEGYRFEPSEAFPFQKVAFHDSCPDRHDGTIARSLRTLFENVEVIEPENTQLDSVCCGSGGFGSVFKQELPQSMFTKSVSDFFGTRARCMVAACATCAAAYKSSGMLRCFHYLELLFGCEMDMDAYNDVFGELWDPANPRNFGTIDSDEPFFK
jgi:fumarate reductase (CoM/CoB) subunit B